MPKKKGNLIYCFILVSGKERCIVTRFPKLKLVLLFLSHNSGTKMHDRKKFLFLKVHCKQKPTKIFS